MKTLRIFTALLALCAASAAPLRAATEITAYITITNTPAGLTSNLTVNIGSASTRHWTNNAAGAPGTSIQTTNSTAASVTNLIAHFGTYPVYSAGAGSPQALFQFSPTNTSAFIITAPLNTNLTVTFGGNWASVFYVTSTFADFFPVVAPTNGMSPRVRTNAQNAVVNLLSDPARESSNSIPPGRFAFRHYADNTTSQNLSNKTLTGPVLAGGRWNNATNLTGTNVAFTNVILVLVSIPAVTDINGYLGTLTNGVLWSNILHRANISNAVAIGGVVHRITNGYWTNAILGSPTTTNLVNYGNAISSPGAGAQSEQFGAGALARGDNATAGGYGAAATNTASTVWGWNSWARQYGSVVGAGSNAGTNSTAIGYGITGNGTDNVLIGSGADDNLFNNVTLIGNGVAASADNEIVIGSSAGTQRFRVLGPLAPEDSITNATLRGTNILSGRLDLAPRNNTGLANGYNSGVVFGTNAYVRFSGPTAAYTNAGFAAPGGPQLVHAQFDNPGLSFTLLNESGIEATAANRILTGTGALLNSTNNPVMATFLYDTTAARWRILNFR